MTVMEREAMSPAQVRLSATLLASSLVGRLPQAMSSLALLRVVLDAGGGYAFAGALTSIYILAGTVGAPLISRVIDRTGRARQTLLGGAAASGLAFAGIALTAPGHPVAAIACTLIAGAAAPPLEPVLRSLWPRIMRTGGQLTRAFSADAAVQELIFVLGPLASAISIAVLGAPGAVAVMGVIGLAGTALFCSHAILERTAPAAHTGRRGSPMRLPAIRTLVLAQVAAGAPVGVLAITATAHATSAGIAALSGWGLALNGIGAFAGALYVTRRPFRAAPERLVRPALLLVALLYAPTAWVQAAPAYWLAAAFVSGVCLAPYLTLVFRATETSAPAALATEANAWVVSAFSVGIGAGTSLAGLLTDHWGAGGSTVAVLAASAVAALGALKARLHTITA
ncbi:MFS transporter [Paractinoplanes deccanensis]|uniref:MFS transporter n=1 Tax=Paractinoplanes deccanensis TaxID=113561 RepID=A0ABQ3Y2E3_9ACTN|nr:MFS transporter [Actinoplanes deccanensis]GID74166.1 MFS transporter [Actinoplanes deccanensis]